LWGQQVTLEFAVDTENFAIQNYGFLSGSETSKGGVTALLVAGLLIGWATGGWFPVETVKYSA